MNDSLNKKAFFAVLKKTSHGPKKTGEKYSPKLIRSIGTEKKYYSCCRNFLGWAAENGHSTNNVTKASIEEFLIWKSKTCCQKTLDGYRQALELIYGFDLDYVTSKKDSILIPRAYRLPQINFMIEKASEDLHLSIAIAAIAGLRAIELDTICRPFDLEESQRDWLKERFFGLEDFEEYVVIGKGGLRRKIMLPGAISFQLEMHRLSVPIRKTQRGIHYQKFYTICGGHNFSQNFSRLSFKLFGWSTGAHGLRHHFAQRRILFLQKAGYTWDFALRIVSQELGHFSTKNTRTYMR